MKAFPYEYEEPCEGFLNEARFAVLNHKNIIRFHQVKELVETIDTESGDVIKSSQILMEYAPYGDLFDAIFSKGVPFNDKLTRTYFRQFIEGLEYLHQNGIAHLDIKPENLLIGEDFVLKICDFDLSVVEGDDKIKGNGTESYRAPELMNRCCRDPWAADIYSAGVILFFMKTQGSLPLPEKSLSEEINFFRLFKFNNEKFWAVHAELLHKNPNFFDEDFRELFNGMTNFNPDLRLTISQIKESKWYNKPVYTQEELMGIMETFLS